MQINFFYFMSWNLNSIAKDNFQRVNLIEAHNSLFKYDLVSICETGLNDSVELPEPLLNEYSSLSNKRPWTFIVFRENFQGGRSY